MADQLITGTTLVEKESRSIGDAPIGAIIAWAKTLAGVPNLAEGWVECDGAVLVDALSPLNGQTIPDLNGGVFLRGDTTSGGTGGGTTHQHTGLATYSASGVQSGSSFDTFNLDDSSAAQQKTNSASSLPPYYNIVWIMKVKIV